MTAASTMGRFITRPIRTAADERGVVAALVAAKVSVHLLLIERYGIHRDEMYFADCGRHLAWGYVDHAPLIPWIARLSTELFGESLVALRIPVLLAGALTVFLTTRLARELGGGARAQLLAGAAVLVAPAFLRMGKMLNIVAFEPIFWTLATLVVVRILRGGDRRLWLAVGAVAGAGILCKHTFLVWGAGLAIGLAATTARRHLASGWLWAGLAVALAIASPNLIWQVQNGFPTVEFIRNMSATTLDRVPRALFLAGQILYAGPFTMPLWIAGLLSLLRDRVLRALGWQFIAMLAILFAAHAKPYYLAAAYPALFAAGGVALTRWAAERSRARTVRACSLALLVPALTLAFLSLPILPLRTIDVVFDRALGRVVPPLALTHDLHDEHGWRQQVEVVARVYHALPPDVRAHTAILTGNYGEASAVSWFGAAHDLPPAISGSMTHHLWADRLDLPHAVIAYGLARRDLALVCPSPEERERLDHPLAVPWERDLPVYVCTELAIPLDEAWPALKTYAHGRPRELSSAGGTGRH